MIDRLSASDVDVVIGTRFGPGVSRPPLLKGSCCGPPPG
jgi:polyprenyl-phospho-N-acetylgalactosaminyl synthase